MPASQANEKTASTTVCRMASAPILSGDYDRDVGVFSTFWLQGLSYLDGLPDRPKQSETEQADAAASLSEARQARRSFLGAHVGRVYRDLTDGLRSFRRIEELAILAGERIPGLCPTSLRLAKEATLVQAEKDGHEIDQGLFFNYVLGDQACGRHLCHAMLLPRKEAFEKLDQLKRHGKVDFAHASVERKGKASIVSLKNSRYLNAGDDTTLKALKTAATRP